MIKVRIPTPLRPFAQNQDEVSAQGNTVLELLMYLKEHNSQLASRILDAKGELRRFINLFINQEDIRNLQGLQSELKAGDTVSIIPAIAGGLDALRA